MKVSNNMSKKSDSGITLLPEREKEIMQLLEMIKVYKPTKVAVEVEVKRQAEINLEYDKYLNSKWALPINEIHQIGFRLAQAMNHKQVYAIDWMGVLPEQKSLGDVIEWAEIHQPELHSTIIEKVGPNRLFDDLNLIDMYRYMNNPTFIKEDHEVYMQIARIGEWDNYIGMDWLRWWYQRNLIIYANLTKLIDTNDERIFLVIGCAHVHTVNQFLKESGLFQVEDAHLYLK